MGEGGGFSSAKPQSSRWLNRSHRFHQFLPTTCPQPHSLSFPGNLQFSERTGAEAAAAVSQRFLMGAPRSRPSFLAFPPQLFSKYHRKAFGCRGACSVCVGGGGGILPAERWARTDPRHRRPPTPATCEIPAENVDPRSSLWGEASSAVGKPIIHPETARVPRERPRRHLQRSLSGGRGWGAAGSGQEIARSGDQAPAGSYRPVAVKTRPELCLSLLGSALPASLPLSQPPPPEARRECGAGAVVGETEVSDPGAFGEPSAEMISHIPVRST